MEEIWVDYRYMYLSKVEYSASMAILTKQQFQQVEQKAVCTFLGSLGYDANMPREVVFAPENIADVRLTTIDNEKGIEHIKALLHHMR